MSDPPKRPKMEPDDKQPHGRARGRARGQPEPENGSSPGRTPTPDVGALHLGGGNGDNVRGGSVPRDPPRDLRERFDMTVTRPEGSIKVGTAGAPVRFVCNYYEVNRKTEWKLYQYRVDFEPELGTTIERRKVLESIKGSILTREYVADGHCMWTKDQLTNPISTPLVINTTHNQNPVTITISFVAELMPGDAKYLQVYNNLVRFILRTLKLKQMGRNYFDCQMAIEIAGYGLDLWPGFVTTLRQHDHGLLYCVELTHKVIRRQTIFSYMNELRTSLGMQGAKQRLNEELVGTIVMSDYNQRTYRVDDIEWSENPTHTFKTLNGEISYVDYYKNTYKLTIQFLKQPLLVSKPKQRDVRAGRTQPIKLIPELCRMTGLTPQMRTNFQLMKEMNQHLFQPPKAKLESTNAFLERVTSSAEACRKMDGMGLQIQRHPLFVPGRILAPEVITFANTQHNIGPGDKADFTNAFRGNANKLFKAIGLNKWVVIVPQRDAQGVENLINTMQKVSMAVDFRIAKPLQIIEVYSPNAGQYIDAISNAVRQGNDLQMIFTIIPQNRNELYAAIKKRCYVDLGISSQCFLSRNVAARGLMSIATKCTIQMCAKLGGEPWNVKIPMKAMIVGFDVHHGGAEGGKSVGAMTCSTSDSCGSYFSCVSFFMTRDELSGNLSKDLTRCLQAYYKVNGAAPPRIFFYRDGVGEGQVHFVYTAELEAMLAAIGSFCEELKQPVPKFTHIICSKRINTRLFMQQGNMVENPPPGSVVDDRITLAERYDFYMIAQAGRQGTVSPTNYNVIYDKNGLDCDKIQRLTFKLCHMYYNWSGTVAVPAVCQYAHKLAALTGMATKNAANDRLSTKLFYL